MQVVSKTSRHIGAFRYASNFSEVSSDLEIFNLLSLIFADVLFGPSRTLVGLCSLLRHSDVIFSKIPLQEMHYIDRLVYIIKIINPSLKALVESIETTVIFSFLTFFFSFTHYSYTCNSVSLLADYFRFTVWFTS